MRGLTKKQFTLNKRFAMNKRFVIRFGCFFLHCNIREVLVRISTEVKPKKFDLDLLNLSQRLDCACLAGLTSTKTKLAIGVGRKKVKGHRLGQRSWVTPVLKSTFNSIVQTPALKFPEHECYSRARIHPDVECEQQTQEDNKSPG
ncbi:hypothetical protein PoB_002540400 [Plakobranchus ocellatus]|uniref:Uncharacterized protein n=1 Tax=Plakobranchus ocellatus TaxID=259542 RepID=A0AAV3ZWW4_9GAST|nr:hypothetical protein PoB_002540400 [Plakobranchus ocellatus]